jgi:DNA-binding transcriptional MerR regulator
MSEARRHAQPSGAAAIRIGELALRAETTPDTIRYYERLGLLGRAERTAAGYRMFPETSLNRLRMIRNAQRFGFTLAEIRGFLRIRDDGRTPCRLVREAAEDRLLEVDARISELASLRTMMRQTLEAWSKRLGDTPDGEAARLLENLPEIRRRHERRTPRT